jgi:ribose transport system permease protein
MRTKTPEAEEVDRSGQAVPGGRAKVGTAASRFAGRYAAVFVFALLTIYWSISLPQTFFQVQNFQIIAGQQAVTGIVALGLLATLAASDYDLSVGANVAMSTSLVVGLQSAQGFPWPAALVVALLAGAAVGLVNAALVVGLGMNSLISTLGVQSILGGLVLYYTGGSILYARSLPHAFTDFGTWTFWGTPGPVLYLVVFAVLMWIFLTRMTVGRFVYIIGSNREAARLSGINTARVRVIAFVVTGVFAAFAGVLLGAQTSAGNPNVAGDYLLPAFAAAFLGATTITPGRFNVLGTLVAVFLVAVGVTGLQESGAPAYAAPIFNGAALVIAVGVAAVLQRRRGG